MSNENAQEFEERDDHVVQLVVSKAEERKLMDQTSFETVSTKFWTLIKGASNCDDKCITQEQYTQLLSRIYKVLAPLYREAEMKTQIAQEWIYDSHNASTMDQNLFTKSIFRIAHQWATSIDINEYCELLNKVYLRIIHKKIVRSTGVTQTAHPHIQVTIDQERQNQNEELGENEWESCDEDEEENDQYNFEVRESGKRYKQKKNEETVAEENNEVKDVFLTARDPFYFKELVQFFQPDENGTIECSPPSLEDFEYDVLTDQSNVFPLGYPTEQYLAWIKNDVHKALAEMKAAKKKTILAMKRDLFNGNDGAKSAQPSINVDRERGLIDENGRFVTQYFSMHRTLPKVEVQTRAYMHDATYNSLRGLFKDNNALQIRPSFDHPSRIGHSDKGVVLGQPLKRFSAFGFNPALERRLNYVYTTCRLSHDKETQMWVNVNYLIVDPVYETAFRADVQRIETQAKMAIKPNEEFTRDEDFNNVTTSFRDSVQVMLQKKYESFFTIKLQGDSATAVERDEKIFELERNRRKLTRIVEPLTSKGLIENFDAKDFLKVIRGPFYKLQSKNGPSEDNFEKCGSNDLIDIANKEIYRVLILAKPRSGKTTLAKQLEQRLNLVRVAADAWIDGLFKKIKDREENPPEEEAPPELEDGQEPPPPKSWLQPLEESVLKKLQSGDAPSEEDICLMLKEMVGSPEAQTRGFVLDLDFAYQADEPCSWYNRFNNFGIMCGQQLTHVVELLEANDETKTRAADLYQNPVDGITYSKWQRDLRANRKKPVDEDGQEIEEEEEVVAMWKPFSRLDLVTRVCDNEDNINNDLAQYESPERPDVDDWIVKMYNSTFIKLPIAGFIPDEIAESVVYRLKTNTTEPITPVAKIIEGGGDFAGLLSTDVNVDEGQLPRQYSLWRTTDPVALTEGKVVPGNPELSASYANNVFCFENEANQKLFCQQPRQYLSAEPAMPADFRVLMVGPSGAGVRSQSQNLHDHYGWRLVDFNKIVRDKLAEIMALPIKPPNNLTTVGPCMVCLSSEELQEIKDGKPFPAWKFLPWIMEHLGVPLMVRPPEVKQVVEPNIEEMTEDEKKAYEKEQKKKAEEKKKKDKEEADAKAAKEERAKKRAEAVEAGQDLAELGLEESEEEIKIEDLPIDQIIVQKDENGNFPKIGQIVLFGFPQTELHITKMKEYGLIFDRVIFLNDQTEEEPGREIKKRMANKGDFVFDFEEENAKAQKVLSNIREFVGEEGVVEVDCTGTKQEVFIKIRTKIDPFFLQADSEEIKFDWSSLPTADEENPRRGPKSDFGDFCPVTYVNSGFLVKGKADYESFVFGKSYRFAGEKEQEEFKFNPDSFLSKSKIPLPPPQPKIMVVGMKGSGVTTQIKMLANRFKIDSLELKPQFLSLMKSEKEKRKRARLLARGFKEPEPVEDEEAEAPVDAEIEDDPAEFVDAIGNHYQELFQTIMSAEKPLVMDGHWTTMPEDLEVNLGDTLLEARRTPEVVVILRCKEANTFLRCIDDKAIKQEYESDCKKRDEEIKKKFEEDKAEKLKEVQEENKQDPDAEEKKPQEEIDAAIDEAMKAWEEERVEADKQALEDDPVPDIQSRREGIEEKMRELLEKDTAFLDEFAEKMKENGVEVIDGLNTDISADFVHIKLLDKIRPRMQLRGDLIEREQAQILKPSEVKFYEESFTYKHSKFGLSSPLSPFNPHKTKQFAVLYRERIYFLGTQAEQEQFMAQPSMYTIGCEPVPQDLTFRPTAVVIGLPSSGKSNLASIMNKQTGMVHLKPEEIIESFITRESCFSQRLRRKTQHSGEEVDDTTFIEMLKARIALKDCCENGWVLDGYPQTRTQAVAMAECGIVPDNVFQITIPIEEVYNRTVGRVQADFECDRSILVRRLAKQAKTIPETGFFYNKYYNSLITVDGTKSRWYMEDLSLESLEKTVKARLEFARDYFFGSRPCIMENLNYDRIYMKQSISQFGYMCPVSWKVQKKFVNCTHRIECCVLYKHLFYYFASPEERSIFVNDPLKFTKNLNFSHERNIPKRYRFHKAAEIISQEKALMGHCPVTLKDEERVEKGYQLSVVSFKDNRFVFASEDKASRFFLNPSRYHQVQLPVKMPPPKDAVLLYQLQKQDESITFMEQALGQVVTRALREVGENRLKYPTLTVKETMLKLFAIFLKAENPANTEYMKQKYHEKMKQFIYRCEVPQELHELAKEKRERKEKGKNWPQFKEDYYNKMGKELDEILKCVPKECTSGFASYMK